MRISFSIIINVIIGKSGIYVVNTSDGNNNGDANAIDVVNSTSSTQRESVTSMYLPKKLFGAGSSLFNINNHWFKDFCVILTKGILPNLWVNCLGQRFGKFFIFNRKNTPIFNILK